MANLFWKTKNGVRSLLSTPFKSEEEFEKTVFETSELLEDIFLLKRQIRGGAKPGIPDIIGLDSDGNVCILEMKNVSVDASIIPQVLQYAFWAETNPDSIKAMWLEHPNKPDDLVVTWEKLKIRILVIAPSILKSTLDIVDRITYPVDLIEVKRWVEGENQLLLVNKLEPDEKRNKVKPVSGLVTYDDAFYISNYNKESAEQFLKYCRDIGGLIKRKEWDLDTKFVQNYCGFKAGFFIAFGVKWMGTKTFAFFVKISEEEAKRFNIPMTKYESQWKEAVYTIIPGKTKSQDFVPIFEFAYGKLTGK